MMEEFHKVRRLPPYVFEQVNRLKAAARAGGADIIDLRSEEHTSELQSQPKS